MVFLFLLLWCDVIILLTKAAAVRTKLRWYPDPPGRTSTPAIRDNPANRL
jgi:hypothetical protein